MVKNSGFKDPINPKVDPKTVKQPYGQVNPQYDERSSIYVDAGSTYGVGHKQPIGHKGDPKMRVDTMPFGKVNTMNVKNPPKRLPSDLEE